MTYALALTAAASLALGLVAYLVGCLLHRTALRWSHRERREWEARALVADWVALSLIALSLICCISVSVITLLEAP